jgi:hypothetical protein
MRKFEDILEVVGGACLAVGIILLFVPRAFRTSLEYFLPDLDPATLVPYGGALVVLGAVAIAAKKMLLRRDINRVVIYPDGGIEMDDRPRNTGSAPVPKAGPQRRVCLKPVWPLRETPHWVGGVPHLPEETPWPQINGRPACFLAQVALDHLPGTIWRGIGPRTGWLVFFGDGQTDYDSIVLHVTGDVRPRPQPTGAVHHWDEPSAMEALKLVIGAAAEVPPRWFIDLTDPGTLGSVEDMTANEDDTKEDLDHYDSERGRWVWEKDGLLSARTVREEVSHPRIRDGSSWTTALAILAAIQVTLRERAASVAYALERHEAGQRTRERRIAELSVVAAGEGAAAYKAEKDLKQLQWKYEQANLAHPKDILAAELIAGHLETVRALTEQISYTAQREAYAPAVAAELYKLVDTIDKELRAGTRDSLFGFEGTFQAMLEQHARLQYSTDPASVPPELFAIYAPLWQQHCAETTIYLGSNRDLTFTQLSPTVFQTGAARLIDLPPNPLTGITIGDASRYYVDLPAEDLMAGDFARVRAANTHGQ